MCSLAVVVAYGAQIAAQLGAHVIKVKPPKDFVEQPENKKVFEKSHIPTKTLADRVRHAAGGGFGSIMGRNAFQRPRTEAIKLLHEVMDIYKKAS